MRAVDIIARKRDGLELSSEEIAAFVRGLTDGTIPDYQVSAWAMAVLLRGMTAREATDLTMAMVGSGQTLDLGNLSPQAAPDGPPAPRRLVVDKHSTGGVGDKTTLLVAPMVAAARLPVFKMSGRGLGYSGGTLDKLESIPGFSVSLSIERLKSLVREHGIALAGQTADLAPADGKLYALRDVTATVPSMPLIASSIMSKKIAGGADAMVLDVKVGRGAFMETLEQARALGELMMRIGAGVGRRVTVVLADMSQPLGNAVGNALEVVEAIAGLRGGGPPDLIEHCLVVGAEMLVLGGVARSAEMGRAILEGTIASGAAVAKFAEWVQAQGGDPRVAEQPGHLPRAAVVLRVAAPRSGTIAALDARLVGQTAVALGAGRERKGDPIDHSVGIVLGPKVGERVTAGHTLFTVHARNQPDALAASARLLAAYAWADCPVSAPPLIYEILRDGQC